MNTVPSITGIRSFSPAAHGGDKTVGAAYENGDPMTSYRVKCITTDPDPEYDDCRCITEFGFEGMSKDIVTKAPETVHSIIDKPRTDVYIVVNGSKVVLKQVEDDEKKYVRTEDEDTPEDPLFDLPACEELIEDDDDDDDDED